MGIYFPEPFLSIFCYLLETFLALPQRLLRSHSLGDVAPETDSANNFTCFQDGSGIDGESENVPILFFHPRFVVLGISVQGSMEDIHHKRQVFFHNERREGFAPPILESVTADFLGALVKESKTALRVQGPDHVVGLFDHGPIFLFRSSQRLLRPLALGDVADEP